jgi:PIN domain nuclease of toxin-antitoxin system
MRLLLDTNIVIRLREDERKIDRKTRRFLDNADAVYVSAVSIWEIGMKVAKQKLNIEMGELEAGLLEAGIFPLPVTWAHALRAYDIAGAHPDPFDRLLLAQAITEPLQLLTTDEALAQYADKLVITV